MNMKAQSRVLIAGVCCLGATLIGSRVQAQEKVPEKVPVATVTKVEGVVEKKVGDAGAWQKTEVGAGLNINDRFRTDKGAKADLKFTDGSLLRLGQFSAVAIGSAKGVTFMAGQLLYVGLQPGRVVAGTATAEIKGPDSTAMIQRNEDGSYAFSLYSGAMDVTTAQGTVSLPPGHKVTAFPDGHLSEIQLAKPIPEELK